MNQSLASLMPLYISKRNQGNGGELCFILALMLNIIPKEIKVEVY